MTDTKTNETIERDIVKRMTEDIIQKNDPVNIRSRSELVHTQKSVVVINTRKNVNEAATVMRRNIPDIGRRKRRNTRKNISTTVAPGAEATNDLIESIDKETLLLR